MEGLNKKILEYKSITDMLIKSVENENYDVLDTLLEKRQLIIEDIKRIKYSSNELYDICSKHKILELQKRLDDIMQSKTARVKAELKKVKQSHAANRSYNSGNYVDSIYFNKKF